VTPPGRRPGAARRAGAWLALLTLLLAALMQGRSYVSCAMDGALHLVACCQVAPWQDGLAFDEPSCCEGHQNPTLAPALTRAPAPLDGAPPAVALPPPAPPAPPLPSQTCALAPDAAPPQARGPPAPPTAVRLARLSRLTC
jgi:hypothetical protein